MPPTLSEPLDDITYRFLSRYRRQVASGIYAAVSVVAYAAAFLIRFEMKWPAAHYTTFLVTLPLLVASRLLAHAVFNLTTGRWRYVGVSDLIRLLGSTLLGTAIFCLTIFFA